VVPTYLVAMVVITEISENQRIFIATDVKNKLGKFSEIAAYVKQGSEIISGSGEIETAVVMHSRLTSPDLIRFNGWAINPQNLSPFEEVVVYLDGSPQSIARMTQDRPGVVLRSPIDDKKIGFEIYLTKKNLDEAESCPLFLGRTKKGEFYPIRLHPIIAQVITESHSVYCENAEPSVIIKHLIKHLNNEIAASKAKPYIELDIKPISGGTIEGVDFRGEFIDFFGWAIAEDTKQAATSIILYKSGTALTVFKPTLKRADLIPEQKNQIAGFVASIPRKLLLESNDSDISFVASFPDNHYRELGALPDAENMIKDLAKLR
jgi:hypothetical protein